MRKLIFTLIILYSFFILRADSFECKSSFVSENKRYELRIIDTISVHNKSNTSLGNSTRYIWGVIDKKEDTLMYQVKIDGLIRKAVSICNEGRYIIVLNNWGIVPLNRLEVLSFYDKDKLIKSYCLGDLMTDLKNLKETITHWSWCYSGFGINEHEGCYKLITHEFRSVNFNLRGEIIFDKILKKDTDSK